MRTRQYLENRVMTQILHQGKPAALYLQDTSEGELVGVASSTQSRSYTTFNTILEIL